MPVAPQDRPIEAVREEAVDQLIMNYGHGRLSRDAFERRLDEALDTPSHDKLIELTRDLDLKTDRQYTARKKAELGIRIEPAAINGNDDSGQILSVLTSNSRKGAWHIPRSIRIFNCFGSTELDFTAARFTTETTYVTVVCLFGSVNLRVREGMRTLSRAIAVLGGVHNRAPSTTDPNAPLLVIEGLVLFGGVGIRAEKMPRQKLREFADHVRTLCETDRPRA